MPAGTAISLGELVALRAAIGAQRWRRTSVARPDLAAGAHLTAGGGRGIEFADSRPYQPGDDVRAIDWRQTARRGKPFSKVFRAEREQPVWLLCDRGPTMRFGSRTAFKSVLAARAAALLAWQAAASGDRVGGACLRSASGGITAATAYAVQPVRRGRDGVLALLGLLADADDSTATDDANDAGAPWPASARGGVAWRGGDLAAALAALGAAQHPGGRLIVLSDFAALAADDAPLADALRAAGRRQAVCLVHVVDRLEVEPPPAGVYAFAYGEGMHRLDLADPALRAAWGAPYRRRRAALARLAGALAATQLELFTDEAAERVLVLGPIGRFGALPRTGA